jgi:hypothetical protein
MHIMVVNFKLKGMQANPHFENVTVTVIARWG